MHRFGVTSSGDAFENLSTPSLPFFTTRRETTRSYTRKRKKERIFLRQLNVAVTFKMTLFTRRYLPLRL